MTTISDNAPTSDQQNARAMYSAPPGALYSCWGVYFSGNDKSKAGWVQDHSGMPALFSKANAENLCPNPKYEPRELYVCSGVLAPAVSDGSSGPGTPSARLAWVLAELAKLFPEASNEFGAAPPELAYFERIAQLAEDAHARLAADAEDDEDGLDHGQTVLDVQGLLGITTTGWVSPDLIKMRVGQLVEFKRSAEGDRRTVVGERIDADMFSTLSHLQTFFGTCLMLLPTVSWHEGATICRNKLKVILDRNFGVQLTPEEAERMGYRGAVGTEALEAGHLVSATTELQAARYRWIRDKTTGAKAAKVLSIVSAHMTDGLDKAVDIAIAADSPQGETEAISLGKMLREIACAQARPQVLAAAGAVDELRQVHEAERACLLQKHALAMEQLVAEIDTVASEVK